MDEAARASATDCLSWRILASSGPTWLGKTLSRDNGKILPQGCPDLTWALRKFICRSWFLLLRDNPFSVAKAYVRKQVPTSV